MTDKHQSYSRTLRWPLTAAELAEYLKVSERTLRSWLTALRRRHPDVQFWTGSIRAKRFDTRHYQTITDLLPAALHPAPHAKRSRRRMMQQQPQHRDPSDAYLRVLELALGRKPTEADIAKRLRVRAGYKDPELAAAPVALLGDRSKE